VQEEFFLASTENSKKCVKNFALGSGLGAPYVLGCLDYGLLSGFS
jgi:hypothetical protein